MTGSDPQAGQNRPLPKREADLFKSVVKHYECKQYKKGTKAADNILRKFPNHGETLAMKGLTLNCMGKRDEAHEYVRKGLMNDMRSHVCWHVFGLLHRSDRNYNEAIKAYKQALRIDPENLQILRDLSLLQIQMRDLHGFAMTRHAILNLKPNNKIHWLAFALAKHLIGDREGAMSVIDIYLGTLNEQSPELCQKGFESGELALYKNKILGEVEGSERDALNHLEECRNVVVDEGAWLTEKARFELLLGEFECARRTFMEMFRRGSGEDYRVHAGYMCALLKLDRSLCERAMKLTATDTVATMMRLSEDQKGVLREVYAGELKDLMPRSQAVRRIPLTFLEGEALREAVDTYCRRDLVKGVPCLGADVSALFVVERKQGEDLVRVTDPVDVKVHPVFLMLVDLVEGYIASLEEHSTFPATETTATTETTESPSTLLWAWYLRAQLYEFCGDYEAALALIERCLEHTPTAVDVYERKAHLLDLSGDINKAADVLDAGRDLDKQDRYINNQTTRYMLMANREEVARERIALFTRHEGNPEQNLYDMQCTWYELELAACFARKGLWGKSLKKYMAVEKHFEDFHEDQFDFHSYCIRKVTLRAYVDVLRFENELWGQDYYGRAAEGIIHCYVHLFDNPNDAKVGPVEPDYSSMTPAERKKAKAAARKKKLKAEKKKAQRQAAAEKEAPNENGDKKGGASNNGAAQQSQQPVDEDPDGSELLKRDPLVEAAKYVATLVKNAPRRFSTWVWQYDVAIRRGKDLMALQALFKARALNPTHCDLFTRIVDFVLVQTTKKQSSSSQKTEETTTNNDNNNNNNNPIISQIISTETSTLLHPHPSLDSYISSTITELQNDPLTSLPMRIAVAKAAVRTESLSKKDAAGLIVKGGLEGRDVTVENCRMAYKVLEGFGEVEEARESWAKDVKLRFPLVTLGK